MANLIVVSVPHRLGKQQALARLQAGLHRMQQKYGGVLKVKEEAWTDDGLAFRVSVFGQSAAGRVEVGDEQARLEVQLSWLLGLQGGKVKEFVQRQGTRMLASA